MNALYGSNGKKNALPQIANQIVTKMDTYQNDSIGKKSILLWFPEFATK